MNPAPPMEGIGLGRKGWVKIGILGGTFNPIHIGHLILAEEAFSKLNLDKVIFVPAYLPPHKDEAVLDAEHRFNMTVLAIEGNPHFEVSRVEIEVKQKSYSIDTLQKFREKYGPKADFFFITGSDSLKELSSWKNIDDVFRLANFIVAKRPGFPIGRAPKEVRVVVITEAEVSASEIRKRLKEKRSIRYLVPEKVRDYIDKYKLYS